MLYKLLCSLALSVLSAAALADGFGQASWGASRDQVRQAETKPNITPLTAGDYLIYEASLPGIHSTRMVYQFKDDRLVAGRFLFEAAPNSATQAWIDQFEQVRTLITQQYGEPEARQALQANSSQTLERSEWAAALAADSLILKTRWQAGGTTLIQQLAWKQDEPHHQVIYRPTGAKIEPTSQTEPVF